MKYGLRYSDSLEDRIFKMMAGGQWGTIGPHSLSGAKKLAAFVGAEHGLLCHSADAAYEAILRALHLCRGRSVLVSECGTPVLSLVPVCIGAAPVFVSDADGDGMPSPEAVEQVLNAGEVKTEIGAVVMDYLGEKKKAEAYPLDRLSDVCRAHGVPLILYAGGVFRARWQGKALTEFADAVFWTLEEGSDICAGKGGLIASDSAELWTEAFARHNCGRAPGEGCSLDMDTIVGGDFRITEWQPIIAEDVLETGYFSDPVPRKIVRMKAQPVFSGEYYRKMTGETADL